MTHPVPLWIERALSRLVGPAQAEAILGDLIETQAGPRRRSSLWFRFRLLAELLRSVPPLLAARIRKSSQVEVDTSMDTWSQPVRRAAALAGLAACLPAALLITGGVLQMFFGTPETLQWLDRTLHNEQLGLIGFLRHPAVVLGGLTVAGALNLLPLLRLGLQRQEGALVGTVTVRMRAVHLAVGAAAAILLAVLLGYAFTENFEVAPRHAAVSQAISHQRSVVSAEW